MQHAASSANSGTAQRAGSDSLHRWGVHAIIDRLGPSVFAGLLTTDGTLVYANGPALDAVGVALEDVLGRPFADTPWWSHSGAARRRLKLAIDEAARGEACRFDFPMRTRDGQVSIMDFSLQPVRNASGEVAFLVPSAFDVTGLRTAQRRAEHLLRHDALTDLLNRRELQERLEERLKNAPYADPLVVLCIDLDRFARLNAALGLDGGDEVLQVVGGRIAACLSPQDLLARFGADEFMVVLGAKDGGVDAAQMATHMAARLLDEIARPIVHGEQELFVTASIGIAFAQPGADADRLLRDACVALDGAKARGRNTFHVYAYERHDEDPERIALEAALRQALSRDEFSLHFQPQLDLTTGAIVAVEALLRWRHPELGLVPPARFVPIAEEAGLIGPIGDWVLETACRTAAEWQHEGLPAVRTMVNLSARQLRQHDLAGRIEALLAQTGLEPRRLGLELTESVLMDHLEEAAQALARLRKRGIEIALDDFGAGHSSLAQLRRLPVDLIKIDRSLVPGVTAPAEALAITRAIIAMAHSLGLKVVAEGVETEGQVDLLAANECDQIQGFHFSPPTEAEAVRIMLREGAGLARGGLRRGARQRTILLLDEDVEALDKLKRLLAWRFGDMVCIEAYTRADDAVRRLGETPLDIVVADFRLRGGLDGLGLLQCARRMQPHAVRMLWLKAADACAALEDRRQLDVFRYLPKSAPQEQLLAHFRAALDHVGQTLADGVLGDVIRSRGYRPGVLELELRTLEEQEPGITDVERGLQGEMLLPQSLLTQPGDLWIPTPAPQVAGSFTSRESASRGRLAPR
jgi:diguanylate cyclase (GGDEF)-like protein/PAS domain S-box-containing protein